jgi:starch-binding outer membrane protein, SusD/RagB family
MKKFTIILSIAAFICTFPMTSCQNILEKAIEGQLPSSQVSYKDLSMMYEPVSGVYAKCRSFDLISWGDRCVDEFRTDFIAKGNGINNQPAMEPVLEKYQYNNTDWFVYQPWDRFYGIINRANTAMLELDKFKQFCTSPGDIKLNDQYRAEIRFWRALAYFRAARYYGNICWFDKNIASIDLRLAPRKEVYDWLIGEIKDFREKLPSDHPNKLVKKGGLTRWAADMLLAKAAADVQDYTTMEQAAGEIVKSGLFSLYPDYYEMLSVNGQLCDENILELQYYYFNTNATFTNIDQWYVSPGMATTITGKVAVGGTNKFPAGWGFSIPSQKYVDLMVKRGETVRLTSSIIYPSTTTPKGDQIGVMNANIIALINKYRTENLPNGVVNAYCFKGFMESVDRKITNLQYGGYNNIRIFRYADALLLYAEALVQKNGAGAGDQYLNLVRKRANLASLLGANIDQINEERGIELAQEWGGDRFFDLVRTGKTSELGSNFTKGEDEFFPTPQVQIDNQPGLTQPPVSGLFPKTFGN